MKVRPNRTPACFKRFTGIAEVNLKEFVTAYPNQRIVITNMIGLHEKQPNYDDEKYIARFMILGGEYLKCEIAYPEDKWNMGANGKAKKFTMKDFI